MGTIFLILYLLFCVLVANAGKNVAIGFWGVLVLSILLTPILTAILILIFKQKSKPKKNKRLEELDLEEDY